MKTAISVPDETFQRVEERAKALGLNRSEFFTKAAERFIDELDRESLTERINAALDATGGGDADLIRDVTEHSRRFLLAATADDEW